MKRARTLLAVLSIAFVVQGSVQLFQPELLTDLINISAQSITGRIELQVIYGGLHIALGSICLWGLLTPANTRAALTVMLLVALGVAIPRVVLGVFHQDFSLYSVLAMALESALAALLIMLLRIPGEF